MKPKAGVESFVSLSTFWTIDYRVDLCHRAPFTVVS